MRARLLPLLLGYCTYGDCAADQEKASEHSFGGADYATFGGTKVLDFSALEKHVLDLLYKRLAMHHFPEVPQTVLGKILPRTSADSEVSCVVYTMVDQSDLSEQLDRLPTDEYRFGSLRLLDKFFAYLYVERLKATPVVFCSKEAYDGFIASSTRHTATLNQMRAWLNSKLQSARQLNLVHYVERREASITCMDLALYVQYMRRVRKVSLPDILLQLESRWLNGVVPNDRMVSVIFAALQIALQPDAFPPHEQTGLRLSILKRVICASRRDYFELLKRCYDYADLVAIVLKYIRNEEYKNISENFILAFADYVSTEDPDASTRLLTLYDAYLPAIPDFHTIEDLVWHTDPAYLNQISARWLRRLFKELCDNIEYFTTRDKFMDGCMDRLEFRVFIEVVGYTPGTVCRKLVPFMLGYLRNKETINSYRYELHKALNADEKGQVPTLAYEEIELVLSYLERSGSIISPVTNT
ncbi:hypothetical protein PAPHI01_0852 [Pancytospora philotis]|nr:hypothetical protein PAPHI01_0852 [Pancytospora philotis]